MAHYQLTNDPAIMRTSSPANTFPARLIRAVDGDTIICDIKLPFGITKSQRIRILDIESWELAGQHEAKALECAARINVMLRNVPLVVTITGGGRDRYGRYRAKIGTPNGDLGQQLIKLGIAWLRDDKNPHPEETHGKHPNNLPSNNQCPTPHAIPCAV